MPSELSIVIAVNRFPELIDALGQEADKRLFDLVKDVATTASNNATRRSGAMAEGIYAKAPGQSTYAEASGTAEQLNPGHIIPEGDIGPHEAISGPSVDYGIDVEYGSPHGEAQPYMVPAAEEVRGRAGSYFQDLLR